MTHPIAKHLPRISGAPAPPAGARPGSVLDVSMKYYIEEKTLEVFENGKLVQTLTATSGKGELMNVSSATDIKNKGPIPAGSYTLDTGSIDDISPAQTGKHLLTGSGDWGDWNAPLTPSDDTTTFDRNNFYIHGGIREGSAGCLDIGGGLTGSAETDALKKTLEGDSDGSVPLEVQPSRKTEQINESLRNNPTIFDVGYA